MRILFLFICLILLAKEGKAQENGALQLCGFDAIYQDQLKNDPAFRLSMEQSAIRWKEYLANKHNAANKIVVENNDTIYEIPIVVHVIHTGGAIGSLYNKSDSTIRAWVDYTNKVWAATWPAYPDTANGGTRIPIRFVLARRSPSCTATNGIDRIDGSVLPGYVANGLNRYDSGGASEAQVRALSVWNPAAYYNIYVVNKIDGKDGVTTTGPYITGYAYFAGAPVSVDGAYMLAASVNPGDYTLPHEMGHVMGLYHTFGTAGSYPSCDTFETDCTTQGDKVCDTEYSPNNLGQNPCPTNTNTNPCTMLPYQNVQYNIMNYGSCRNRFTPGQSERAVQQMLSSRMSLINSLALDTTLPAPATVAAACTIPVNILTTNNFNIGPCNVQLNTINYTSVGYSGDLYRAYINHIPDYCADPNAGTDLIAGTSYQFTVTTATNPQRLKAFLDYNNDGIFDSNLGEQVLYIDNAPIGTHTVTLTPPLTATLNTYLRLRIMSDTRSTSSGAFNYGPCDTMRSGQVEDFYVRLLSNSATALDYISGFTASTAGCSVALNWVFGNKQEPVTSFILEHSNDGKSFTELENIGTGNNTTSYFDIKPFNGTNYYRLKWINADNSTTYSTIQYADVYCKNFVKVYPNPFENRVTLTLNAGTAQQIEIDVQDVSGRKVWETSKRVEKGSSKIDIDLSHLSHGVYILKINGDNDINDNIMIVKAAY